MVVSGGRRPELVEGLLTEPKSLLAMLGGIEAALRCQVMVATSSVHMGRLATYVERWHLATVFV